MPKKYFGHKSVILAPGPPGGHGETFYNCSYLDQNTFLANLINFAKKNVINFFIFLGPLGPLYVIININILCKCLTKNPNLNLGENCIAISSKMNVC